MVFIELIDPITDDYGQRILRLPQKAMDTLNVAENDVVEIIANNRRVGVIVQQEITSNLLRHDTPAKTEDHAAAEEVDKDLPKPEGIPFRGIIDVDRSFVVLARLDGEVRASLGLNIGEIAEIDITRKPQHAREVFLSIIGQNTTNFSEEKKQLLSTEFRKQQKNKPLTSGLQIGVYMGFAVIKVIVQATNPDEIVVLTNKSIVEVNDILIPAIAEKTTYDSIGGMKDIIIRLRKLIEAPLKHPELFKAANFSPPKGILISGPPGVGKSLIIQTFENETGAKIIRVPQRIFTGIGSTEKNLRKLFDDVREQSRKEPVALLLENLELFAAAGNINQPEYERRFAFQLASGIDSLKNSNVVIIGICHSAEEISSIVRRAGRFDIEIEINIPTSDERLEILKIHLRSVPIADEIKSDDLDEIANRMIGYVGADIAAFIRQACMCAISRNSSIFLSFGQTIPPSVLRGIKVSKADFNEAFKLIEPSALRSINSKVEVPKIKWEEIGGLAKVKQVLREHIEWQFKYPDVIKSIGINPPRGILLYGPPGTGKTLLAKAIATEIQANFISVKGPELFSVWFGESAKKVRELFERARKMAPTIIFFDEVDAMVPRRGADPTSGGRETDATVNQLLTLLDGIENVGQVVVVGATNRPKALDPALLRPGRLDRLVLIPAPDQESRTQILDIHTRKIPIEGDRLQLIRNLAEKTDGFSGADLENLVREAVMSCLRADFTMRFVKPVHFYDALSQITPSITPELIKYYENFAKDVIADHGSDKLSKKPIDYL